GDANLDGTVDTVDFNLYAANYSFPNQGPAFASADGAPISLWSRGDFNYSGTVDTVDFNLYVANFGRTTAGSTASESFLVPEPSSLAIVSILMLTPRRRLRTA